MEEKGHLPGVLFSLPERGFSGIMGENLERGETMKKVFAWLLALVMVFSLAGCGMDTAPDSGLDEALEVQVTEDGHYDSKEEVAAYLWVYGQLPENYITKNEARDLGWEGGSLEPYAPGYCIGGSHFGNYEGLLPEDTDYTECDIDTMGAESRGPKRIVFSDDGYIYYTGDHYESFSQLWFEDGELMEEPVQ